MGWRKRAWAEGQLWAIGVDDDLGSIGSVQVMLCIPITTSVASGRGVSDAGALSVHHLCCWEGRCWFLECVGNRQLLGKP